jgi:hypothetical protein
MNDKQIEEMINEKGLNAPRVTLDRLHAKIKDVEIVKHITNNGQVLRLAVLTMENGFAVTGDAYCSVSPENNDAKIGEDIAITSAQNEVWKLEGYALRQKLYEEKLERGKN